MTTKNSKKDQFEYNRVRYPGVADGLIQLRNIELLMTLFGLPSVDLENCRVLELGCADGTNLMPFAEEFATSEFVGVDLAATRIVEATATRDVIGLSNIEFRHANVTEISKDWGTFDFVLCTGIFSWATADERDAILRICRDNLNRTGVAVVSFNARPGWNFLDTVRELIRRHVRVFDDPQTKIVEARRVVEYLAAQTDASTTHGLLYSQASEELRTSTDHYVYHDYISDRNQPFYFHEFQSMLEVHDLQFVTDADLSQTAAMRLPDDARRTLDNTPIAEREQLLDFLTNAKYRRAMICHAEIPVNRNIDHASLPQLSFTLRQNFPDVQFDPSETTPLKLEYNGGSLTTVEPLGKAALRHIIDKWPRPVPLDELHNAAQKLLHHATCTHDDDAVLGRSLLTAVCAGLGLAFRTPPVLATEISERPQATRVSRHAAAGGSSIVNQWHLTVSSLRPDERFLLSQLDGSRTVAELTALLGNWRLTNVSQVATPPEQRVSQILHHLLHDRLLLIE